MTVTNFLFREQGQFNYACIIVQPLEMGSNLISVRAKGDIEDYFKHLDAMIISDRGAPLLARQLALHANVSKILKLRVHSLTFQTPIRWLHWSPPPSKIVA